MRDYPLSLPHALRYRVAFDQPLCTAIHRILAGALLKRLRWLAREQGMHDAQTRSVTIVQRYGGGLKCNRITP